MILDIVDFFEKRRLAPPLVRPSTVFVVARRHSSFVRSADCWCLFFLSLSCRCSSICTVVQ